MSKSISNKKDQAKLSNNKDRKHNIHRNTDSGLNRTTNGRKNNSIAGKELKTGDSSRKNNGTVTYQDLYRLLEVKPIGGIDEDTNDLYKNKSANSKAKQRSQGKPSNTKPSYTKPNQGSSWSIPEKVKPEGSKSVKERISQESNRRKSKKDSTGLKSSLSSLIDVNKKFKFDMKEYQEHLLEKQKIVKDLIGKYCKVDKILGMEQPYYYRNKVHAVFDHDKKGNPISGIYEEGTHNVIPMDSCIIDDQDADKIIVSIRSLLKSFKIRTYDEDTGYGLLRHVLIRKGFASGEIMVVLVLADTILPSKNNFVKALLKLHPEITTIIINVNDKQTSMILGDKEQVIYGKGYIEDTLCGKVFRISPKSFYQVNPIQTDILYSKAIELAKLTGKETIIDAYCGIGTIGMIASDRVKKVIGVELNKDAVKDAIINVKRNQINNVEIYNNDAGEFMRGMADQNETVDVVFMDPPRAGSDEQFLSSIVQLKPKKVVYISCNPVTLARDLEYLTKKGYKASLAVPVDMFPWTEHVECIVGIRRTDS